MIGGCFFPFSAVRRVLLVSIVMTRKRHIGGILFHSALE